MYMCVCVYAYVYVYMCMCVLTAQGSFFGGSESRALLQLERHDFEVTPILCLSWFASCCCDNTVAKNNRWGKSLFPLILSGHSPLSRKARSGIRAGTWREAGTEAEAMEHGMLLLA